MPTTNPNKAALWIAVKIRNFTEGSPENTLADGSGEKAWGTPLVGYAGYVRDSFDFDGYGCGLCQTAVPCASGIPALIEGR